MVLHVCVALLAAVSEPALRLELLEMERLDQAPFRKKALSALAKSDWDQISEMRVRHAARLAGIIRQYGWPGRNLVGADGANAAFLLVQHADHDVGFQRRCLQLMEPGTMTGDVSKMDFAYLTDRVLVSEGKKQIYGTQAQRGPDGRLRPAPVEDPKNLGRRRKSVGLMSERKYLRTLEKVQKEGVR